MRLISRERISILDAFFVGWDAAATNFENQTCVVCALVASTKNAGFVSQAPPMRARSRRV